MRGLPRFPLLVLAFALASVQAQPGPERLPEGDSSAVSRVRHVAKPVRMDSTPTVSAVKETPRDTPAVATKPVKPDSIASLAKSNVPRDSMTATAPAAARDSAKVTESVKHDSTPSTASSAKRDSLSDSARMVNAIQDRGSAASAPDSLSMRHGRPPEDYHGHTPPRGMMHDFRPPVAASGPAPVAAVEEPLTPYEDERGLGHNLKNDPRASKLYRSPRKAFFYSLIVPGSGQAWCHSYVRAGIFVAAEVGLLYGWYQISVVDARDKSREADHFADAHWSASRYENKRKQLFDEAANDPASSKDNMNAIARTMPYRDRYCDAIYALDQNELRDACNDFPSDTGKNYLGHLSTVADSGMGTEAVHAKRVGGVKDLTTFYERIGRDAEFMPGWDDATVNSIPAGVLVQQLYDYDRALTNNTQNVVVPWGTSQNRAVYLGLRSDADKLASTQGWFLGGLVVNHILSAIDAALTAQRSNRRLYTEEKTTWVDGLHVQGGLAWTNGPSTRADMFLEF